jgi:uncharacterized membrane protein
VASDPPPCGEVVAAFEDHTVALPRPTSCDLRAGLPHLLIFVGLVRRLVGALGRQYRRQLDRRSRSTNDLGGVAGHEFRQCLARALACFSGAACRAADETGGGLRSLGRRFRPIGRKPRVGRARGESERLLGALHRSNHVLHILATSAWLGALIPILLCLSALDDAQRKSAAGLALRRFSVVGHGAVLLVVVTGAADVAFVLGGWPTDWSSPYQRLLTIKIGLVALMVGFALLNRYIFVPRIERAPRQAIKALRYTTIAELASGLMVLALVAAFGTFEPA